MTEALARALGPPDGRLLGDIAGGTGNYARELRRRGFRTLILDVEPAMLARAAGKVPSAWILGADVHALPLRASSLDCAMVVVASHLFADRVRAFAEIRRALRDGPLAVVAYTRENLASLFVHEYFGGAWPDEGPRTDRAGMQAVLRDAGFARVSSETFVYPDAATGSLVAMHTDAAALADEGHLRNTSFWHRLEPVWRTRGLAALRADLESGRLAERVAESRRLAERTGHGTIFVARP